VADYDYAIAERALRTFVSLPSRQRRRLLRFFEELARHPFQSGTYQEHGSAHRVYELQLVDHLLVTWWCDHAVREVRVMRIERIN